MMINCVIVSKKLFVFTPTKDQRIGTSVLLFLCSAVLNVGKVQQLFLVKTDVSFRFISFKS